MKNLRVAVVPTETGRNSINQQSSVEKILACKQTVLYPLTDYFKAQNDEDLPMHFSFLIDIEKNVDLTGTNIDGVHYNIETPKTSKINYIIGVLKDWGETSCVELQRDHSPSLNSMAGGNIAELVEEFKFNGVSAVTYDDQVEIGWNDYSYEELPDDVLDEIVQIMEDYEAEQLRTAKRCSD
jgi:hypothetical protein